LPSDRRHSSVPPVDATKPLRPHRSTNTIYCVVLSVTLPRKAGVNCGFVVQAACLHWVVGSKNATTSGRNTTPANDRIRVENRPKGGPRGQ
jgi:hypothetical protein